MKERGHFQNVTDWSRYESEGEDNVREKDKSTSLGPETEDVLDERTHVLKKGCFVAWRGLSDEVVEALGVFLFFRPIRMAFGMCESSRASADLRERWEL